MPTCACIEHERICSGESSPVLKISNKKIKKETVEKLRSSGLIGRYCNFVCQKCVSWIETGNYSKKRTYSENLTTEIIYDIENGIFSQEELVKIVSAIGNKISDCIYDDSVDMSVDYVNPENIVNLDLQEWISKRNPVLTKFLMSVAKCNEEDTKKRIVLLVPLKVYTRLEI